MRDLPNNIHLSIPWLESALVLSVGTLLVVAAAWTTCRFVRSSIWQRTVWQIASLGLVALLAAELTGAGAAVVEFGRAQLDRRSSNEGRLAKFAKPMQRGNRAPGRDVTDSVARGSGETSSNAISSSRILESPFEFGDSIGTIDRQAKRGLQDTDQSERLKIVDSWGFTATYSKQVDQSFDTPSGQTEPIGMRSEPATSGMEKSLAVGASTDRHASRFGPPTPTIARGTDTISFWRTFPLLLWGSVSLVLLGRIVWARIRLFHYLRSCTLVGDHRQRDQLVRLGAQLRFRQRVRLLESGSLSAPVTFGILRATIILPRSFAARFDRSQQNAVLAHELAHLAAGDPAWQLLASILCSVLWWHPLIFALRRCLHATSEAAADEASLLIPNGPDVLAECLVSLGRELGSPRRLGWLSVEGAPFRSELGKRVHRLLQLPRRTWQPPQRRRSASAKIAVPILLVLMTILCTAWARPRAALAKGDTTMTLLSNSWQRSLAATALLALVAPLANADNSAADNLTTPNDPAAVQEDQERERAERREERKREVARDREESRRRDQRESEERERDRHEDQLRVERETLERVHESLVRKRDQLHAQAADLERELGRLRDDQDDEAEALKDGLEEAREHIERINRELKEQREERELRPHEGVNHSLFNELMALQNRAFELELHLHLMPDDQREEAGDLRREREKLEQRIQEINKRMPELPRAFVRERMHQRLNQLEEAVGRLRAERRFDIAEELQREMHEIARELERRTRDEHPREESGDEDLDRRNRHVIVAIDNLHAAGLHDLAEKLAQDARNRMNERRPRDAARREDPDRGDRDLRAEMEEMRNQMNEMRQMIKELYERNRIR